MESGRAYTYTPYGFVTVRAADANWTPITGNVRNLPIQPSSPREYSFATLLNYYRGRYDDPVLERFVNRDPAASSPNLYEYCDNNPLIYVDPSGLVTFPLKDAKERDRLAAEAADAFVKGMADS